MDRRADPIRGEGAEPFAPLPRLARQLGFAGLLPQIAVVLALLTRDLEWRFTALALGFAYAALILSFLGGLWWGLAARATRPAPWMWFAAVAPSLIALATAIPWSTGAAWPGPSLWVLGLTLIGSLFVDRRFRAAGLTPPGWMALRTPLSLGLGLLTIAAALL